MDGRALTVHHALVLRPVRLDLALWELGSAEPVVLLLAPSALTAA